MRYSIIFSIRDIMVKMKIPSLKHRKPIVYISLGVYLFLIFVIIFESCLPSSISGNRSNLFAQISAWFINSSTEPITPKSIDPVQVLESEVTDSTYLGKGEDEISNIAIGTTSLVSVPFKYPTKANDYDVYNYKYTLDYPLGNKDDYNVILSSRNTSSTTYTVDMRIVANNMSSDLYQINVKISDAIYEYKFHIVPLAKPTSFEYRISKNSIKIGESVKVETKLTDSNRTDTYLRRYFDESLIDRSSLNDEIASIDEYGVIHGKAAGETVIKYGNHDIPITVSNESIVKPITNSLTLSKTDHQLSLLDYDYIFNDEDDINDYSTLVYASFADTSLEDQSVSWTISDNQKAKLAPYKYDDNGYPVYMDDTNRPCVRVSGYRQKGDVTIYCFSNNDNTISSSVTLNVNEAIPTEMSINVSSELSLTINEQKVITASFSPKNVNNKNIHVDVSDAEKAQVLNNDSSSVTLTGTKVGKVHITVTSLANNSIKKEFDVSFTAKDVINKDNFDSFAAFVRKAAGHFLLFLVTALVGTLFFYVYLNDDKHIWLFPLLSLGVGVLVAGISELIQYYIPSRSGLFSDVGIDSLGYLLGTLITFGVMILIRFIKKKKEQ